jgi:hypothetical protein
MRKSLLKTKNDISIENINKNIYKTMIVYQNQAGIERCVIETDGDFLASLSAKAVN